MSVVTIMYGHVLHQRDYHVLSVKKYTEGTNLRMNLKIHFEKETIIVKVTIVKKIERSQLPDDRFKKKRK